MAELLLTESEARALLQELTEWLTTKDERRSRYRENALKRVLEKVEHASTTADWS